MGVAHIDTVDKDHLSGDHDQAHEQGKVLPQGEHGEESEL